MRARSLLLALAFALSGCGSSSDDAPAVSQPGGGAGSGGASGTGGASGAGGGGAAGAGGLAPLATGTPTAQVVRTVLLGDTDEAGAKSSTLWKSLGFDLDGVASTPGQSPHCTPVEGAKAETVQQDGDGGIDNAFGQTIIPLFAGFSTGDPPTVSLDKSIAAGNTTLLFAIDNLPSGADDAGRITGSMFAVDGKKDADGKRIAPTDDEWAMGTYAWNLLDTLLVSTSPPTSKVRFEASTLAGNVWDAGAKTDVILPLAIKGVPLNLKIRGARLSMSFAADHKSATGGRLGGVLVTEEFVADFVAVGPKISSTLCSAKILEILQTTLRRASDIMKDGTQVDGKTCDGISIGIGFATTSASVGSVVAPDPPTDNPCPTM